MSKKLVYVVGYPSYQEYVNWCDDSIITDDIKKCDFIMGCGGSDVDPSVYGHIPHRTTSSSPSRDKYEIAIIKKGIELGKPIWGTCRFAQLLCALQSDGFLIQNMTHPYLHKVTTYDGKELMASSSHHQLQCVNDLNPETYKLIAWGENISPYHQTGNGNIQLKNNQEAEIVFYKSPRSIACQMHPEYLTFDDEYKETIKYCQNLLKRLIEGDNFE